MRETIEKAIHKKHGDAKIWDTIENDHYVCVRFTSFMGTYMATLFEGSSVVEFFRYEEGVRVC